MVQPWMGAELGTQLGPSVTYPESEPLLPGSGHPVSRTRGAGPVPITTSIRCDVSDGVTTGPLESSGLTSQGA